MIYLERKKYMIFAFKECKVLEKDIVKWEIYYKQKIYNFP